MSPRRLLARLLQGHLDNVAFDDFVALVLAFGSNLAERLVATAPSVIRASRSY